MKPFISMETLVNPFPYFSESDSQPDTWAKHEYETRDIRVWAKIFIASLIR